MRQTGMLELYGFNLLLGEIPVLSQRFPLSLMQFFVRKIKEERLEATCVGLTEGQTLVILYYNLLKFCECFKGHYTTL